MRILSICLLIVLYGLPVWGFGDNGAGCGAGKCSDCHSLDAAEAAKLLQNGVDRVLAVEFAELPGLWVVDAEKNGQKFPLYIDFSKKFIIAGNVVRLADGQNMTLQHQNRLNGGKAPTPPPQPPAPTKIDFAKIPLKDAIVLGKADAKVKVVVFTDPDCPYCKKLHDEMREVVRRDPGVAFYIKLFPLKIHPNAYGKSKAIVCSEKPLAMLEASFAGAPLATTGCETKRIDDNLTLGEAIGIRSTPTLVLPDGTIVPGAKKSQEILRLLGRAPLKDGEK